MQWSDSKNAGFSEGTPWIKVNPNYKEINVESQINNEGSILKYYRKLVALRKSKEYNEIFTYGDFEPAYLDKNKIFAFYRELDNMKILVAANFGETDTTLELERDNNKILLSNMNPRLSADHELNLKSCEVVILLMNK